MKFAPSTSVYLNNNIIHPSDANTKTNEYSFQLKSYQQRKWHTSNHIYILKTEGYQISIQNKNQIFFSPLLMVYAYKSQRLIKKTVGTVPKKCLDYKNGIKKEYKC